MTNSLKLPMRTSPQVAPSRYKLAMSGVDFLKKYNKPRTQMEHLSQAFGLFTGTFAHPAPGVAHREKHVPDVLWSATTLIPLQALNRGRSHNRMLGDSQMHVPVANKKSATESLTSVVSWFNMITISILVLEVSKSFHEIRGEIDRWREILAVPYQEFLLTK